MERHSSICSFCGKSEEQAGRLTFSRVLNQQTAICIDCARNAVPDGNETTEASQSQNLSQLSVSASDTLASIIKGALGAVPFVGSLIAEFAGNVIPNQRLDRVVKFATILEQRLNETEKLAFRANLTNENFTDLIEESLKQATKAASDERLKFIASVIANGLSQAQIDLLEPKTFLKILGELSDTEIIWLCSYSRQHRHSREFEDKHKDILSDAGRFYGAPKHLQNRQVLLDNYDAHLLNLGLLAKRISTEKKHIGFELPQIELPEFDRFNRDFKFETNISKLGEMFLAHIGIISTPDNQGQG
jgi:hypothetical protein